MIGSLTIEFQTPLDQKSTLTSINKILITASKGNQRVFEGEYLGLPSRTDVDRALLDAEDILDGQPVTLVRCNIDDREIVLVERNGGVAIDIQHSHDGEVDDIDEPMPVEPETVVNALIEFGSAMLEQFESVDAPSLCYRTQLAVGIDHARACLEYYQEREDLEGFESTIATEHLEVATTDCVDRDPLRAFVVESGALRPFVHGLTERDDDEFVEECYNWLLGVYEEYSEPTAEVLVEHPDERSLSGLIGGFYSELRSPTLIRAMAPIADQNAAWSVGRLPKQVDDEPLSNRRAAIDFLESVPVVDLLKDRKRERLIDDLETALIRTEDQELRTRIVYLLDDLET